jgi:hypothetical protein
MGAWNGQIAVEIFARGIYQPPILGLVAPQRKDFLLACMGERSLVTNHMLAWKGEHATQRRTLRSS